MVRFFLSRREALDFRGRLLTLGRQTVVLTPQEFKKLFGREPGGQQITDGMIFKALGVQHVESLDSDERSGASIIHDLNLPLSNSTLDGAYDMVLDGGTLEHCFNVGAYMQTMTRLVKRGGSVLHMNPCQGYTNHGFYNFQPTFYFDFYGANGFGDPKCWLLEFKSRNYYKFRARMKVVEVADAVPSLPFRSTRNTLVVFTAKKKENVAAITFPLQSIYAHAK